MKKIITILLCTATALLAQAQRKTTYTPIIEPCACPVQPDSSLKTICGYLIVPENRQKPAGKTIKLPFIRVSSSAAAKKDPVLFTGGGPGSGSLGFVRSANSRAFIRDRDLIAFEQRGTNFAVPALQGNELSDAIKESYRNNLSKDSMVLVGVERYRKSLLAKGIDLTAYNTKESVADIGDLLTVLKIDSVNLWGVSYSGGLMPAVLQQYPARIRSMILDSPLPMFINIDEDEIANFNEALHILFLGCEKDSTDKTLYGNMEQKFRQYFLSLEGKSFYMPYIEKTTGKVLNVQYGRNELLDIVIGRVFNFSTIKDVPYIINELIKGNHAQYMQKSLDGIFNGHPGPSGMRMSVYCSDKMPYATDSIIHQQYVQYPHMAGYHINDVYRTMCDCWKVPAIAATIKKPFYSNVPVLLGAGDIDPATRPLYNDILHHYMPNSQRVLFYNRSHCPLSGKEGDNFIKQFLDNPFQQVVSDQKDVVVY